ncbi:hypothetical protein [Larkinella rosea]|uniref:Uncharacterized protein n=1 Tax=Larkinella rosea TaxID=2025312 RepID=A0A3P1BP44_9BACT|nr:hypothetical protein [Larkinella rosea]RRB02818.1 hypothetical protein EHT25_20480 [Larkinella rosea]
MKVLSCLLLLTAFACQSNQNEKKSETPTKPDAYRDLLVDRVVWNVKKGATPQESATNRHRFTITNTSESYLYRHIEVQFDYFDSTYHKIGSAKQIIEKSIGPRAALAIGELPDDQVKPEAKSSTVKIVKAESARAEQE